MRRTSTLLVLGLCLMGCQSNKEIAGHDQGPHGSQKSHRFITGGDVKWQNGPASLPPGAKIAVLEGDPAKAGFFAFRLAFPDGYRIPPHFHPKPERITVLSGTFNLGQGDRFDDSSATALPAGAYATMPEGMHHYAFAKGETVVQLSGIGPWGITYINPADDPRKAAK